MSVDSINPVNMSNTYYSVDIQQENKTQQETVIKAVKSTEDSGNNSKKLRGENGVLRLLEEGHFKGNAEMRLREIFHRELTILGLVGPENETNENAPEIDQESVALETVDK